MTVDQGKVGEYQFATELLKRGYTPSWPSTETEAYDIIFVSGASAIRVQVKTSSQKGRIQLNIKRQKRKYRSTEFELLVVWAMEKDIWYLIPMSDVQGNISIQPTSDRCKWRKFKNAWHLLKALDESA